MGKKGLKERYSGTSSTQIFFLLIFNLELICACEFFKKLKLHSAKRLVQKLTRANIFQIELETV